MHTKNGNKMNKKYIWTIGKKKKNKLIQILNGNVEKKNIEND